MTIGLPGDDLGTVVVDDLDASRCPVHGRVGFCNELAWAADGVLPGEYPTRDAVEQVLREKHIDLSEAWLSTAKCGWTADQDR